MTETKQLLRFIYGVVIGIAMKKPIVWFLGLAKELWDAVTGIGKVDDEIAAATDADIDDLGTDAEAYFLGHGLDLGNKDEAAAEGLKAAKHIWNLVKILRAKNA